MRRGSQDFSSPRLPEPGVDAADYRPEVDVERLAQHFAQRYGSLAEARKALDPEVELKLVEFELALKKWGVKVDNVVHFFAHIDEDYSGSISVEELLNVLDSPLDEIQRREKLRQRNEVKRIFEEMARSICDKFGSIEEAFNKHGSWLHSTSSSLSLAQFGRLAKQLDIELEAAVMQRVFNEIDEDKEGSISVEELQQALSYPIVRYVVVEIASLLHQKYGGVVEAFESIGEIRPGSVSKVPPPPMQGERLPVRLAPHEGVSQEHFLKVLRQLKVLDNITDSAATMIWTSLQPFTMQDFVQRLLEEHRQAEEEKQRHEEDRERREKERKRRLAESLCLDSRQRAAKEVNSWLDEVRYLEAAVARTVTARWAALARVGASKTQLRDYVSVLQGLINASTESVEELKRSLGIESGVPGPPAASPTPFAGGSTPRFFGGSDSQQPAQSGGGTPLRPLGPAPSPQGASLDENMQSEHRTRLAERLSQAATVGDVGAVQRILLRRADPNSVVWGGVTALMSAARHGRVQVAKLLLANSAEPARTDMLGRTALDHARSQPARLREWLRGRGVLARAELEGSAEALGRRLLELQKEWRRLEEMRNQIPSEDVIRRTNLLLRLGRASSHPDPGQGTPALSVGSPYPGHLLVPGSAPGTLTPLERSCSYPGPAPVPAMPARALKQVQLSLPLPMK
ncbi:unnamed protein product [Symbiodinium natans]|uniref:EF-hand domain-containing protein n=1 Tax=Symbiodinium natans TaxID=878477 RepID=A0A812MIB9_9DINO|nr:unnamed protein product [Symbiodinium natans]